jgi:DNA-binding GntR family transcriptional regulator
MGSTHPQRWAPWPPGLAWKRPGCRATVRVLERHPEPLGLSELPTEQTSVVTRTGQKRRETFLLQHRVMASAIETRDPAAAEAAIPRTL